MTMYEDTENAAGHLIPHYVVQLPDSGLEVVPESALEPI